MDDALYRPAPIDNSQVQLSPDLAQLVEKLARNNHELWAKRRTDEGWRYGPRRDDARRETPVLVPYDELPESEKEYDRAMVVETLKAILKLGGSIQAPPPVAGAAPPAADPALEDYRRRAEKANGMGESLEACDIADAGLAKWPKDPRLRQMRALALARMGSHTEARDILAELCGQGEPDEETLGLLARTYKDLWLESDDANDLERAYAAYAQAYAGHPDRYWTGVNTATLAYAKGDGEAARKAAEQVLDACRAKLAGAAGEEPYYLLSSIAEASLVLGDLDEAARRYAEASPLAGMELGRLSSTLRNARIALRKLPAEAAARIEAAIGMPRVAVFTGHRTDEPGRARPRFPNAAAAAVGSSIRARLMERNARVAYASAASGGDILFLEAMQSIGGRTHVVLPCNQEQFLEESVTPSGEEWAERFRAVLGKADEVMIASEERLALGSVAYEYANELLHGLATARAAHFGTDLVRVAVWDGLPAQFAAGTADVVSRWSAAGHSVDVVDPLQPGKWAVLHAGGDPTGAAGPQPEHPANDAGFGSEIRGMIFADAFHFSKLGEAQVPAFIDRFIRPIAALASEVCPPPIFQNTWGDGLFFVFGKAADAGRFAMRMAETMAVLDRTAAGLPETINLRIGLHAGPVYRFPDRIIGKRNYIGSHVNRTARIEPVTPPGKVYGSYAFVAMAALEAPGEFRCDYVGRIPLAKGFGEFPMYRVRAGRR